MDPEYVPLAVVAAVMGVLLLTGLWAVADAANFYVKVPVLKDADDLDRYKRLAARNMYGAVVILGLFVGTAVGVGAALAVGVMPPSHLPLVFLTGVPFTVVGLVCRLLEVRVRRTPAPDAAISAERDRVTHVWETKAFPDW